jgi:hypothetical protein
LTHEMTQPADLQRTYRQAERNWIVEVISK